MSLMLEGHETCYNLAARRHARYLTRLYDQHLAPIGLSVSQFSLLAVINKSTKPTIAELSEAMVMERTTLMRAIARLENDGLVERSQNEGQRFLTYSLTHAGRAKLKAAAPMWQAAQRAYEALAGGAKAAALRDAARGIISDV
ncbi:MarR family transcriptional regulator (plasmid) [Novosphingobium sp. P6W]|nr:MarR family transcriptional regulator [Novosphingobium sp. P6W]